MQAVGPALPQNAGRSTCWGLGRGGPNKGGTQPAATESSSNYTDKSRRRCREHKALCWRQRGIAHAPIVARCEDVQRSHKRPDPDKRVIIFHQRACVTQRIVQLQCKVEDPHKVPAERRSVEELQKDTNSSRAVKQPRNRVRHSVAIYGQLLLFCDQSMREKAWRGHKRGALAM